MILINHIASSSKGNAILIDDRRSKLLLDCGLSYRKIARFVRPSSLSGVLITHEHLDHCKATYQFVRRGIPQYMSKGTWKNLQLDQPGNQVNVVQHGLPVEIGTWKVLPFDVRHDAAEPLGFLIQSKATGDRIVYIVDSAIVDFSFENIQYWLIECNHSAELLESGPYEGYLERRVRQNHFSLESLKTFLGSSDLSQTEEIHLLHLSDVNSDERGFVDEVQRLTGVPTYAA